VINAAMLYLINRQPGWDAVRFLTADTRLVLGWVNLSIFAGLLFNLVYLAMDPPWFKALGDLVTTGISVVALIKIWRVFPFDFTDGTPWPILARIVLVVAILGSLIAVVVQTVTLAHHALDHNRTMS